MNILQLISGVDVNGALVYCKLLTNRLVDLGHHVVLGARTNSWILDQEISAPTYSSSMRRYPMDEIKRFSRLIREHQIDLIHTHQSRANHFGVCLNLFTGVPVVASAHSRQWQLHWRLNNHVIANSDATAEYMRRVNRVRPDRMTTTHCFVDLERFLNVSKTFRQYYRRELHLDENDFLVGVVGDVTQRKGHEYLVRALKSLTQSIPNLTVAFIGRFHRNESYTKKVRAIIKRDQVFRTVKWLGLRSNIHEYMQAFDVLCVPSVEEPLGMVAIEGQAAGIPVIAADTGGLNEIVQHGVSGLLFRSKSVAAVHEAILETYHHREQAAKMAATARANVADRFCPEHLTNRVIETYQQILNAKSRTPISQRRAA
ncbi:MAG: glycosyltransferase family 4 protein [Pirellulaceae bacterium]